MFDGLEGWHIVIIVVVAALLFGSGKLPGAARSIGQSLRIFKSELKAAGQDDAAKPSPTDPPPPTAAQPIEGTIVTHPIADPVIHPVSDPTPQTTPTPTPTQQPHPKTTTPSHPAERRPPPHQQPLTEAELHPGALHTSCVKGPFT
jgi:sec-independent protein translocase protein TatA